MGYDHKKLLNYDLNIESLGEATIDSPLKFSDTKGDGVINFVSDEERILAINSQNELKEWLNEGKEIPSFEKAGPRSKLYFTPGQTRSAVVTCGGLCPGLNSVIRALAYMNYYRYHNQFTYGVKYGYEGFIDSFGHGLINLTPETVEHIHKLGGTMLGSSRGPQDSGLIVDKLTQMNVSVLYTIGGDGTLRGAKDIADEIKRRNLKISVIGIPKTIDNDIMYTDKSFGFETAFSKACEAIDVAHVEAKGAYNGIGIVKVMGRSSGFVAANAATASNDVNFCLIPEVPFKLEGPGGFLEVLKNRLQRSHHAVILVAEGAGQNFFDDTNQAHDASGNKKLFDIGLFLKEEIKKYMAAHNVPTTVKYIDPSYIIRSTEPTPNDSLYCFQLAQHAVHAGMAGKTNLVIGRYNGEFVHLPMDLITSEHKRLDTESEMWLSVLETTGQPVKFGE
ncbi:MAG: ATP-dependent 6-phosphofructokinase [Spirochaetales bacterium]|nr:ATP-dependent 6-phosphofructokinase [Spirochaetales bacterium]